jgi:type III restriction enzyme
VRRHRNVLEKFATVPGLHVLQYDEFTRYSVKMATGSGKTKVMALAVAWHFFNAVAERSDDHARTFVILAPNVIVFERLRADFGGGRIFQADPMIAPELRIFWDFDCYMRGDPERASSQGALYLSNIQQLYDRPVPESNEPEEMTDVLGPAPPTSDGFKPGPSAAQGGLRLPRPVGTPERQYRSQAGRTGTALSTDGTICRSA